MSYRSLAPFGTPGESSASSPAKGTGSRSTGLTSGEVGEGGRPLDKVVTVSGKELKEHRKIEEQKDTFLKRHVRHAAMPDRK